MPLSELLELAEADDVAAGVPVGVREAVGDSVRVALVHDPENTEAVVEKEWEEAVAVPEREGLRLRVKGLGVCVDHDGVTDGDVVGVRDGVGLRLQVCDREPVTLGGVPDGVQRPVGVAEALDVRVRDSVRVAVPGDRERVLWVSVAEVVGRSVAEILHVDVKDGLRGVAVGVTVGVRLREGERDREAVVLSWAVHVTELDRERPHVSLAVLLELGLGLPVSVRERLGAEMVCEVRLGEWERLGLPEGE